MAFFKPPKKPPAKLTITSLLDVLTIILIFLLTNFSEEAPDTDINENVKLPIVEAKSKHKASAYEKELTITLGVNRLEMGENVISFKSFEAQKDQILELLANNLAKALEGVTPKKKLNSSITLHADKEVTFNMIQSFMATAATVGITQVEFVGVYEPE